MAKLNLSVRMKSIIEMIKEKRVADVGCDHAFVSIALVQLDIADYVVATDLRKGPIDIARSNIAEAGYRDKIITRISDGLQNIEDKEVDCAVIAGMGGGLIVEILKNSSNHIKNGIKLVLQPQSEPEKLRAYLYDIGYYIEDENMVFEEGKYYQIIRAVPCENGEKCKLSSVELMYGPILLGRNEVLHKFLLEEQQKTYALCEKLDKIHTEKSQNRINELEHTKVLLEEAIKCFAVK